MTSTLNGVPTEDFDRPAQELHEAMLRANLVRNAAGWSFNGWTADGRPVRHRIKIEGYVRTGPKVELEAAQRRAAGLPVFDMQDELRKLGEDC